MTKRARVLYWEQCPSNNIQYWDLVHRLSITPSLGWFHICGPWFILSIEWKVWTSWPSVFFPVVVLYIPSPHLSFCSRSTNFLFPRSASKSGKHEGSKALNLIRILLNYFNPLYKESLFFKGNLDSIHVVTSLIYYFRAVDLFIDTFFFLIY